MQEAWGIPWEGVRWAALPLGGGVGRSQALCGALNGGAIALGLRLGQRGLDREDLQEEARERAAEMMRRFREAFGHVDCAVLTGHDFNDPEEHQKWLDSGLREERCVKYVGFVARHLAEQGVPGAA